MAAPFCFIPLTHGKVAKVDAEDFDRLSGHKWYAYRDTCTGSFYARRTDYAAGKWTVVPMHREIMGAQKGQRVDHIFHDTLDNRKSELRLCTQAENARNRRINKKQFERVQGRLLG